MQRIAPGPAGVRIMQISNEWMAMTPDDDNLTDLIRTLENERYAAMIAGDVGALDRLLSDRLVYGHSNAARDSKDSFLERVRDRTFVYESIDHPEERIIIAGGAVVVLGAMIANVYLVR